MIKLILITLMAQVQAAPSTVYERFPRLDRQFLDRLSWQRDHTNFYHQGRTDGLLGNRFMVALWGDGLSTKGSRVGLSLTLSTFSPREHAALVNAVHNLRSSLAEPPSFVESYFRDEFGGIVLSFRASNEPYERDYRYGIAFVETLLDYFAGRECQTILELAQPPRAPEVWPFLDKLKNAIESD